VCVLWSKWNARSILCSIAICPQELHDGRLCSIRPASPDSRATPGRCLPLLVVLHSASTYFIPSRPGR
jgi:hypothetical protein